MFESSMITRVTSHRVLITFDPSMYSNYHRSDQNLDDSLPAQVCLIFQKQSLIDIDTLIIAGLFEF